MDFKIGIPNFPANIQKQIEDALERIMRSGYQKNNEMEPLSTKLVSKGQIFKIQMIKNEEYEASLLILHADSAIITHVHTDDSEWYLNLNGNVINECLQGNSHSLENPGHYVMFVVSVKRKV